MFEDMPDGVRQRARGSTTFSAPRPSVTIAVAVCIAVSVVAVVVAIPRSTAAQTVSSNPIVVENAKPGTPGWRLRQPSDDLHQQIKGYAGRDSVDIGEAIDFHVSVDTPQEYTIEIFRLGHYGGTGARLVTTIGPLDGSPQPHPPLDPETGFVEYDWPVAHRLVVPEDWVSGVYLARLTNASGFDNFVAFVVRDDDQQADLIFQRPTLTDHAYNAFPNVDPSTPGFDASTPGHIGKSLYDFNSGGDDTVTGSPRAVRISLNRPMSGNGVGLLFTWEFDLLSWLEREGYNVTYTTNVDTHADPSRLLDVAGFISPAHDEYWTGAMFDAAEQARDQGVNLAFMGANSVYHQVRLEAADDGSPLRTVVTYKSVDLDPEPNLADKTALFRQIGRAEQQLIGIHYVDRGSDQRSDLVPQVSDHWMFDRTGLSPGDVIPGVVGSEIDRQDPNQPLPEHLSYTVLAESPYAGSRGPTTHQTTIYQAPSGAWVFASGTLSWSWGLGRAGHTSPPLQQMTRNLLDRFVGEADGEDPTSGEQPVSVRVRGVTGEELVRLYDEDGRVMAERRAGTQWQTVTATVPAGSAQLYVGFVNDAITATGADRNLLVDAVTWHHTGDTVQAESVESRGVWNGSDCGVGYRNSEFLACNGWFRFPVPASDDEPDTPDDPGEDPEPEAVEIVVTARGTTGTERLELEVDGSVVDSWTPTTTFTQHRHLHGGPMPALVRVLFTNDGRDGAGRDRNSIVEEVKIGSEVFDPVEVRSKGVWNGHDCDTGFRESTFLACNGWFEFILDDNPDQPGDDNPDGPGDDNPDEPGDDGPPTSREFSVRLRGTTGGEMATIEVDSVLHGPYPVATNWGEIKLDIPPEGVDTVRVGFINDAIVDGADRNLIVDRLTVDGTEYPAAGLVARGVWDGTSCTVEKVHGTGYLACNGWVQLTLAG